MTPNTVEKPKVKTSVGMETVDETMARARKMATPRISPESLQPTPEVKITPPPAPVQAPALEASITEQADQFTQNLTEQRKQAESTKTTALADYINQLKGAQTQTSLENTAYAQTGGVNDIQVELNDINDQIRREQRALENARRAVTERGGGLASGAASEIANLERVSLQKQADLSVIQMAVQGRYDSAREIADRAVKAQLEQQNVLLETLKFNYLENKEVFNKAEQREFDTLLANRTREIQAEEDRIKEIKNFALKALEAGASVSETKQMMAAKTLDEAMSIGGGYLRPKPAVTGGDIFTSPTGTPVKVPTFEEFIAQKEQEALMTFTPAKRESFRKEYESEVEVMSQAVKVSQLSPIAREIVNNPQVYYDLTPTERGKVIKEMSQKGLDTNLVLQGKKKALPATQAENLVQAVGVKKDVEKLNQMMNELPGTGPIAGRVAALNPYDPKRVAIEAQITRIVPGLARGIFQEVGVLTDDDATRYRGTLTNPNLTPEQRQAIHEDTMQKIEQSIQTTLDTYGALGYDLGRFETDVLQNQSPTASNVPLTNGAKGTTTSGLSYTISTQ